MSGVTFHYNKDEFKKKLSRTVLSKKFKVKPLIGFSLVPQAALKINSPNKVFLLKPQHCLKFTERPIFLVFRKKIEWGKFCRKRLIKIGGMRLATGIGCQGYDAERLGCHTSCRRWPKS